MSNHVELPEGVSVGQVSDGYHTFDELYECRKVLNALLFNSWAAQGIYDVHKSLRHHDGERCFGTTGWFVVCAVLPEGQVSFHYPVADWCLFHVPAEPKARYPFDHHTTAGAIKRLTALINERGKIT
jgi:hypothetical protein